MALFEISVSGDGDVYVRGPFDEEKYMDELNQDLEDIKPEYHPEFFQPTEKIPTDPMYWSGNSRLLIRGEVVAPKEERVVTKLKL